MSERGARRRAIQCCATLFSRRTAADLLTLGEPKAGLQRTPKRARNPPTIRLIIDTQFSLNCLVVGKTNRLIDHDTLLNDAHLKLLSEYPKLLQQQWVRAMRIH